MGWLFSYEGLPIKPENLMNHILNISDKKKKIPKITEYLVVRILEKKNIFLKAFVKFEKDLKITGKELGDIFAFKLEDNIIIKPSVYKARSWKVLIKYTENDDDDYFCSFDV